MLLVRLPRSACASLVPLRVSHRQPASRRAVSMSRSHASPATSALTGATGGRSAGESGTTFRVATYNVLSSHLASPEHFRRCKPEDLAAAARLPRVLAKLEEEVARDAVICLQEVSMTWAGALPVRAQSAAARHAAACSPP
jgi:mRNA deadenylase 3'-5' endonuclease subunit Ccr4